MKNIALTLLATAAVGVASMGSVSAMPLNNVSAALGEGQVQNVRLVCNRYGRCYNSARYARPYYAPRYYNRRAYGYYGNNYGYYGNNYGYAPGIGVGVGPVGVRIW